MTLGEIGQKDTKQWNTCGSLKHIFTLCTAVSQEPSPAAKRLQRSRLCLAHNVYTIHYVF